MRGKKRAYTFIRGTEVHKFNSAADARDYFGKFDQKWPSKYIKTGWHGWTIKPEEWKGENVKKKIREPVKGVKYKKAVEYMTEEDEIYYIGSATGFICIVDREEFFSHVKVWNQICKKRIKESYREQKKRCEEAIKTGKNIAACKAELLKRWKSYSEYVKIENRPVLDCYKRILGGTVLLIPGDEIGNFWEREEYVSRCPKYGLYPHDR